MTLEEKDTLRNELCAMLPYATKLKVEGIDGACELDSLDHYGYRIRYWVPDKIGGGEYLSDLKFNWEEKVKPYLRRMETLDIDDLRMWLMGKGYPTNSESINLKAGEKWLTYKNEVPLFQYFLMNYYDYKGLIDKGLAVEVTKDDDPYDEERMFIERKKRDLENGK